MQKNIGCIHLFQSQLGLCNVNCEWNRLCSQTVGIGHSNVGIKKNQLCVVVIVAMCSYSEICTCCLGLELGLGLNGFGIGLGLGLDVLASFNITVHN